MSLCFDSMRNQYDYCSSHLPTYITIGIIIPIGVIVIVLLVYVYLRLRQRRSRRAQQQVYMANIVPVYNSDEQRQSPFNYSYPPHYASMSEDPFDKPPSYEQTVQQVSEIPRATTSDNNPHSTENPSATLPDTTPTEASVAEPTRDRH